MNYAELTSNILLETENTDTNFSTVLPQLVKNAERRIYKAVKLPFMRKVQSSAFTDGNRFLTMPADYLDVWELASIINNVTTYLLPKDVSFIREAYANQTTKGAPKYYAQYDDTSLLIGPTPSAGYSSELHYFYFPETIVTASTTWLGDNFGEVLLYGTLVEAAVFMKSDEDVKRQYQEQYAVELKLLADYAAQTRSGKYRGG